MRRGGGGGGSYLWLLDKHLFSLSLSLSLLRKQPPFYFYVYFEGSPPAEGHYAGQLPNFICSHVPMEIFLSYKTGKKLGNWKRVVYIQGGSHTCAFSWGSGTPSGSHPWVTLPHENALVQGPPLQHSTHTQLLESKTKVGILAFRGTSICFNFTMAFESLVSLCVDYLVFWWDKAPPIKPNSKHPNLIITIREKSPHALSFLYLVVGVIGKPWCQILLGDLISSQGFSLYVSQISNKSIKVLTMYVGKMGRQLPTTR